MSKRAEYITQHSGKKLILAAAADSSIKDLSEVRESLIAYNFDPEDPLLYHHVKALIVWLLSAGDPTPNHQYLQWLTNKYCQGDFCCEDLERIQQELAEFERLKPLLAEKDINKYKSIRDVYVVIQQLRQEPAPVSNRQAERTYEQSLFDNNQATLHFDHPDLKVIIPHTQEAAVHFGRGTRWCTAATKTTNHFTTYNNRGTLYVVYVDSRRYQFHFEDNLYADELDQQIAVATLVRKFPILKDAFKNEAYKHSYIPLMKFDTSEDVERVLQKVMVGVNAYHHAAIHIMETIEPHLHNLNIALFVVKQNPSLAQKYIRKDLQQTIEFKREMVISRPASIVSFPKHQQTHDLALRVIDAAPMMLRYIRPDLMTDQLLHRALDIMSECLGQIPRDKQTPAIIKYAIDQCPDSSKQGLIPLIHTVNMRDYFSNYINDTLKRIRAEQIT